MVNIYMPSNMSKQQTITRKQFQRFCILAINRSSDFGISSNPKLWFLIDYAQSLAGLKQIWRIFQQVLPCKIQMHAECDHSDIMGTNYVLNIQDDLKPVLRLNRVPMLAAKVS